MLALIDNLGAGEFLIVMVAALLVFGKRLPQVAADAGKQLVKLRRSLDQAWKDTGMEREIRQVQSDLHNAIPRDLSIGDMARMASTEMDKRIRANEDAARYERGDAVALAGPLAPAAPASAAPLPAPQRPHEDAGGKSTTTGDP